MPSLRHSLLLIGLVIGLAGCGELTEDVLEAAFDAVPADTPIAPGAAYKIDGMDQHPVAPGTMIPIQLWWGASCTFKSSYFCKAQPFRVRASCGSMPCTATLASVDFHYPIKDGVVPGSAQLQLVSSEEGLLSPEVTLIHDETGEEAVLRLPALTVRKAGRLQLRCTATGGKYHECVAPVSVPALEGMPNSAYFGWAVVAETPEGKPLRIDPLVLINGAEVPCSQNHQGDPGWTPIVGCGHDGPRMDRWQVEARLGDLSASTIFVPEP